MKSKSYIDVPGRFKNLKCYIDVPGRFKNLKCYIDVPGRFKNLKCYTCCFLKAIKYLVFIFLNQEVLFLRNKFCQHNLNISIKAKMLI